MKIVIPFKSENAKSRLSGVLTPDERRGLALCMLNDVIDATDGFDVDILTPSVLSGANIESHILLSELGLNEALNEYLRRRAEYGGGPVMIVMGDLPLVLNHHITEIACSDSDVVIAPGKGGGTNILCIKDPSRFRVDYYGTSFLDHLQIAHENDLTVGSTNPMIWWNCCCMGMAKLHATCLRILVSWLRCAMAGRRLSGPATCFERRNEEPQKTGRLTARAARHTCPYLGYHVTLRQYGL